MPVQKGKRRRRPRRRSGGGSPETAEENAGSTRPSASSGARPARRRWRPPLYVNLAIGLGMLAFGVVFAAFGQKGMSTSYRLLLLLGYLVVAGFYLGTAYRQYRAKRRA